MKNATFLMFVGTVVLLISSVATADPPKWVGYQGELKKNDAPHHGAAEFKFALISEGGLGVTTLWSNDGTSVGGSEPQTSIETDVQDGVFDVSLGEPPMIPLTGDEIAGYSDVKLRVWVSTDGAAAGSFEQLPDQPVGSGFFALAVPPDVSFAARSTTSQQVTGGSATVVEFGTVDIDGPWFTNNSFIAPTDGVYDIDIRTFWANTETSIIEFFVYVNGVAGMKIIRDNTDFESGSASYRASLSAGDVVDVRVYSTNEFYSVCSNESGGNQCLFSGHLVHR